MWTGSVGFAWLVKQIMCSPGHLCFLNLLSWTVPALASRRSIAHLTRVHGLQACLHTGIENIFAGLYGSHIDLVLTSLSTNAIESFYYLQPIVPLYKECIIAMLLHCCFTW